MLVQVTVSQGTWAIFGTAELVSMEKETLRSAIAMVEPFSLSARKRWDLALRSATRRMSQGKAPEKVVSHFRQRKSRCVGSCRYFALFLHLVASASAAIL